MQPTIPLTEAAGDWAFQADRAMAARTSKPHPSARQLRLKYRACLAAAFFGTPALLVILKVLELEADWLAPRFWQFADSHWQVCSARVVGKGCSLTKGMGSSFLLPESCPRCNLRLGSSELPRRRGHFMLFRARRAGCRRVTRSTRGVPVTDIHRIGETPVGLWVDAADLEVLRCSPKGCPEILDELQLSRLSRSRGNSGDRQSRAISFPVQGQEPFFAET
jgi:hypothetical protein